MRRVAPALCLALGLGAAAAPAGAEISLLGFKNTLVDFALDQISVPGELEIAAERVEDSDDGATDLVGVSVSDGGGVWLTIERLSMRWNPSRILRGELEVERLAATGVTVLRRPNPAAVAVEVKEGSEIDEAPSRGLLDWPRAPIDTRIDSVELIRVVVAPGVIAEPGIAFDATGRLIDEGDEQSARFNVTRRDAIFGRIEFDYVRDFDQERLDLTLAAFEEPGGIVAALAGLPNNSTSRFELDAAGPLADWELTLGAEIDRVVSASGSGRVDATGRLSAAAELVLRPGEALGDTFGPGLAAVLSPEARLAFDLSEDENGLVTVREGSLRAADLDLDASGTYDRRSTEADLALRVEARAGLARLAEGVEFERVGFDGSARGPLDDLTAEGRLALAGLRTAPADIGAADLAATVRVQGAEISAEVEGGVEGIRLDRIGPELIGRAELSLAALYDGDSARLDRLSLVSAPLTVEAEGEADLAGETADLSYRASTPDLAPFAAAYEIDAAGRFVAEGRLEGPFALPRLVGSAAFENLAYGGEPFGALRLEHDATFGEAPEGEVSLRADGSRFGQVAFVGGFRLDGDRLALSDLTASGLGAEVAGAVEIDLATSLATGAVDLSAPDLSTLEPATGRPASGAVSGRIGLAAREGAQDATLALALSGVEVQLEGGAIRAERLDLDLAARDALGDPSAEGRVAGAEVSAFGYGVGRLAFEGKGERLRSDAPAFDGTLDVERAALGPATLASARISAQGDLAAFDATAELRGLAGDETVGDAAFETARFEGRVENALGDPAASGKLTATDLSGYGGSAARLDLSGSGASLLTAPAFDVTAEAAEAAYGPATLASARIAAKGDLAAFDATAEIAGLSGDETVGDAALATARFEGRVENALGDPSVSGRLTASDFAGYGAALASLDAEGSGRALLSAPEFDATAKLGRIEAGGAAVAGADLSAKGSLDDMTATLKTGRIEAEGAAIATAALDLRAREAASGDPALDGRLTLGPATLGGAALASARVEATGRLSDLAISSTARGETGRGEAIAFDAAARAALAGPPSATVSRLSLEIGETRVGLNAPLRVRTEGGTTSFEGLDLALPGGGLTGTASLHGDGLSGDLALDAPDLRPIADLAGAPLESGALSAAARFDTRPGRAGAEARIDATGLRFSEAAGGMGGVLGLEADLRWDGRSAVADAALSGPFGDPFRLSAALPLRASGGALPTVPPGGALSGSADWEGRIGDLWALVPAGGAVLDGDVRVALRLSGTVDRPQFGGEVALTDGRLEHVTAGTILVDLEARSRVEPGGAFVVELSAHDGSNDPVRGRVALADGQVDARIEAEGATLVRRDDVTAAITLDIAATGPIESPSVSGRINIDQAEIRLVAATPPGIADLGPVRIKGEEPPPEKEPFGNTIPLSIDVTGPQDIFVRGRGLDSEWSVDLQIRGTAAAPVIAGAIEKRRGTLDFIGRTFDLDRGAIRFTGGAEIDPILDIALMRDNDGVRGGIVVKGTALDPDITFESRPALPEEEVLPRVLFGQSKQSLSPAEALALAAGLATLLDGTGGPLDRVRGAVGLDVLRIEGTGSDDASVTVGRNVASGVFVGAKRPIQGGAGSVVVEIEVIDDLHVESEMGPDVGTQLGVTWKHDF